MGSRVGARCSMTGPVSCFPRENGRTAGREAAPARGKNASYPTTRSSGPPAPPGFGRPGAAARCPFPLPCAPIPEWLCARIPTFSRSFGAEEKGQKSHAICGGRRPRLRHPRHPPGSGAPKRPRPGVLPMNGLRGPRPLPDDEVSRPMRARAGRRPKRVQIDRPGGRRLPGFHRRNAGAVLPPPFPQGGEGISPFSPRFLSNVLKFHA